MGDLRTDPVQNSVYALAVAQVGEQDGQCTSGRTRIPLHDGQGRADSPGEVDLVDDQQLGPGDAGASFARDFVAAKPKPRPRQFR